MTTKNGKLTPAEKAFWKDVFVACVVLNAPPKSVAERAVGCADFADAALNEYRNRIIWRKH